MRKSSWFLIVLVILLFIPAGVWGAQNLNGPNQMEVVSSGWIAKQVKIRQPIWDEEIEAAQFAAGEDEESKSVLKFLKAAHLVIPSISDKTAFWVNTSPSRNKLGVLIFTKEDSTNSFWTEKFEDTTLATFEYPLILVRPHHRSGKLTKGLVMLQQGYLAMHCHEMGDKNSFYLFQVKCLEMLSRAISQKFPGYTEKVVGTQILLSENALWLKFNLKGLEMIYGKKAWRAERLFQKGLLTLHAVLEGVKRETYADNFKAMMVRLSILFEDYEEETDTGITMIQALAR